MTPNAAEAGGVKLDSWTVKPKMDPNDPAAAQLAMVNMFIFGATGQMSGFLATNQGRTHHNPFAEHPGHAAGARRPGRQEHARGRQGRGGGDGRSAQGSMMRGPIGTKSVFDLVMGLSFTGKPVQPRSRRTCRPSASRPPATTAECTSACTRRRRS